MDQRDKHATQRLLGQLPEPKRGEAELLGHVAARALAEPHLEDRDAALMGARAVLVSGRL
jgi:hypothetical protein